MHTATHIAAALIAASLGHSANAQTTGATAVRNTLGMTMVPIAAGRFDMGNHLTAQQMAPLFPGYELQRLIDLRDEYPRHTVHISRPFFIAAHEVTVGQFREFLRRSGHVPESVADGTGGYGFDPQHPAVRTGQGEAFVGRDPRYSWQHTGFAQTDQHPVVNVTWGDAQALARWLSDQHGQRYRLPTEAEWEYVCRAGSTTLYPGGDHPSALIGHANVFDADAARHWAPWAAFALNTTDGHAFTAPVGSFAPNAFGVYDMLGNVWEWTQDLHGDDSYAQAAARSPATDPSGPATGSVRVRRGGSWHTWPMYARCGYRNWNTESTRYTLVGIRLVMEAPAPR